MEIVLDLLTLCGVTILTGVGFWIVRSDRRAVAVHIDELKRSASEARQVAHNWRMATMRVAEDTRKAMSGPYKGETAELQGMGDGALEEYHRAALALRALGQNRIEAVRDEKQRRGTES